MFSAADWKHSFSEMLSTESWKAASSSSSDGFGECWGPAVSNERGLGLEASCRLLLLLPPPLSHAGQALLRSRCCRSASWEAAWPDVLALACDKSSTAALEEEEPGPASPPSWAKLCCAALLAILRRMRCLIALASLKLLECLATVTSASSSVELSPALCPVEAEDEDESEEAPRGLMEEEEEAPPPARFAAVVELNMRVSTSDMRCIRLACRDRGWVSPSAERAHSPLHASPGPL